MARIPVALRLALSFALSVAPVFGDPTVAAPGGPALPVTPPGFVARTDWGAAQAKPGMRSQVPRRLTVHHTATRSPEDAAGVAKLLRGVQRYHQEDRKWHDIAYHYLVDRAGRVHEGRDPGFEGASGTVYDLSDRVLVCLIGDFTADLPPEDQWDRTVSTLAWLCRRHGIDPVGITMHRDHAETTCPGDAFAGLIADGTLVEAVRRALGDTR